MKAIGVDLGTTNSVIAYINPKGQPEVIASSEGGRTIPSVFCVLQDGTKLIGKAAVDQEMMNAHNTIRSIKRKMGTTARVKINDVEMSPEEISSEILKKIKADAEAYLGETVDSAVITVPAYFNNDQRQSTKIAGELAGLKVLRVINEPTAASLAYGLEQNKDETVLVFDLGGGTFDVTILEITDDGVFDVKSTSGDTFLGGDDFDNIIKEILLEKLNKSSDKFFFTNTIVMTEKTIITLNEAEKARLREAAEHAKMQLSAANSALVNIPYLTFGDWNGEKIPVHLNATITREEFENHPKTLELVKKIKQCVDNALNDAKMDATDIDQIVFVGGSTRVPLVGKLVEEWTHKKPNRSVNPDEAVAIGAAIQAGILTGERDKDILLLDVIPLTLGIETLGGVMTVMIPRNTTIPTEHVEVFSTAEDNQEKVDIKVYQGERPQAIHNKCLGEFHLLDILPAPRGVPQIEVTFLVDANGILSVKAKDVATDNEQEVTITGSSSLSSDEISKIISDAQANAEADKLFKELSAARSDLQDKLLQVESILRDMQADLDEKTTSDLNKLKVEIENTLQTEDIEKMKTLTEMLNETIKTTSEEVYKKADEIIMGD